MENKIYVSEMEYGRLCRVDGRMDALIDYLRSKDYVEKAILMAIVGLDYFYPDKEESNDR